MFRNMAYRNMSATQRKYKMLNDAVPAGYKMGNPITAKKLTKGMKLLAYYNSTNEGVDAIEVMGFTGHEGEYGAGGIKFESAKELLAHYEVKTFKALEELQDQNEYPNHSYLWIRFLEHDPRYGEDNGPWFYLFEGRWSRGSGAEALSFIELVRDVEVPNRALMMED